MREVELEDAALPLVMAVDIGSSSVRALLYDLEGQPVSNSEHQIRHQLHTTPDGGSTANADALVSLVCTCIDHTLANTKNRAHAIKAVGLTSFWHSVMGLTGDHAPSTPVYMWADKRSGNDADELASTIDEQQMHTETGCRIHSSYWPAKLLWLKRTDPDRYDATQTWASFPDYLAWTIHRELTTSISMASGTGLLHSSSARWHPEMLTLLGLKPDNLPKLTDRDIALRPPIKEYRLRWPELVDASWFPAIGDGATANVGAGCVGNDRIALTIGTSGAMRSIIRDQTDHKEVTLPLSPKLWQYRLDRRHRVTGGALSNGGNIAAWWANIINDANFSRLTEAASKIPPDGHGLTTLPFLAGERSPSWNDHATGAIFGLRLATTNEAIYRSFLEATAYRFASIYDDLQDAIVPEHRICANGAAALGSPLWMHILSDVLNHPIESLGAEAEASARGAAICALESIHAIDDLLEIDTPVIQHFEPNAIHNNVYDAGRARLERYETAVNALTTIDNDLKGSQT